MHADGRCTPVPTVLNAVPDSLLATNNSRVTYHCETGYTFPAQQSRDWVTCNGVDWLGQVPDCTRMNIHCLRYFRLKLRTASFCAVFCTNHDFSLPNFEIKLSGGFTRGAGDAPGPQLGLLPWTPLGDFH